MFFIKHLLRRNALVLCVTGAVGAVGSVVLMTSPQVRQAAAVAPAGNGTANSSTNNGVGPGSFTLTGVSTQTLRPGVSSPVSLTMVNTYNWDLVISGITLSKPLTTTRTDCGPQNFTTTPYSGPATLTVPSGHTSTLTDLHVPSANWPQVTMVPGAPNACQGVGFSLGYAATATKK